MSAPEKTEKGGWKLFSVHCRCLRQDRMYELLRLAETNERRGEVTAHADFPHPSKYRVFYSAERNGFLRPVLVPKARSISSSRARKAYVITEAGRSWVSEHRKFLASVPDSPDPAGASDKWIRNGMRRRHRDRRPGEGMVPVVDVDARVRAARAERRKRAIEAMEARKAAERPKTGKGAR